MISIDTSRRETRNFSRWSDAIGIIAYFKSRDRFQILFTPRWCLQWRELTGMVISGNETSGVSPINHNHKHHKQFIIRNSNIIILTSNSIYGTFVFGLPNLPATYWCLCVLVLHPSLFSSREDRTQTNWMFFIPFNLLEDISPNRKSLSANT